MTQPTFVPYPSTSTFTQEWIDQYVKPYYGEKKFHVTEKIHGKAVTIEFDGENFLYGRRKDYLPSHFGKGYAGIATISKALESRIRRMYVSMREVVQQHHEACDKAVADGVAEADVNRPEIPVDFKVIKIRGEYFGGSYNHPEVPKVANMETIKSGGIQYSQEVSFSTYRIEIDDVVLPFTTMGMLCLSYHIPHVPLLFSGTLQECIDWSAEHKCDPTVIPAGFCLCDEDGKGVPHPENPDLLKALPRIENNNREGHVIVPEEPVVLPNGKSLILKDKNPKFAESKFSKTPKKTVDVKEILKGELGVLYDAILCRLTTNRLDNVLSHKDYELKEFNLVMGTTIQDAIDEFLDTDAPETMTWARMETSDRKVLMKQVGVACRERLGEHFRAQF